METPIRVVIADDNADMRRIERMMISRAEGFEIVGEAEDGVQLLTIDHSIVEYMVQRGELTQEQAKNHPGKNVITRAVGTEPSVEGDIYIQKLHRDDCLLLCSDGLSNVMADQEMLFEVVHGMSKSDCCQRLLHIAKKRGAPDNVTVALAAV